MRALVPYRPEMAPALLALWHAGPDGPAPLTPALWQAATHGDPDFRPEDLLVAADETGSPTAFLLAKRYRGDFPGCEPFRRVGTVALLAVATSARRRGLASALLATAEERWRLDGATRATLGGSFHHLMPGVPLGSAAARTFFASRGYQPGATVWDVRRDLSLGPALPDTAEALARAGVTSRPFRASEGAALVAFLERAFAGRWARDVALALANGEPVGHFVGVFLADGPLGFAWLHPPGSPGALRWAGWNPGIAALGPIGLDASLRGSGLGLALLVQSLRHLQALGASDTVIDWTDLLGFYGRCGFAPWLGYELASKPLG